MSLFLLLACATSPEGLLLTPPGSGPLVRVDWDAKPLADIPFPNDLATRPDPTSVTGLRLNISKLGATEAESEAREKLDHLTGFGIYAPISVGFGAPLDLDEILVRHTLDPELGQAQFGDDAVFLINVDPDSPDFGKAMELDIGHGRYPMDVPNPARYFDNDSRDTSPSLVFDTVDEDLNDNGVLDWGEDTDNDGVLDFPNVWPEGGDPREDLLTWYERQTDTLILRPVVPLREETTYAVVLTSRLIGTDGEPVRSPWKWVHHLRQTEALRPLTTILPDLGVGLDELAFSWVYTTGRVTGDLVDISRGLRGEGPFASLETKYPAGIREALPMHNMPGVTETWSLPTSTLVSTLVNLGLFDASAGETLVDAYTDYAEAVVSGSFTTPYFLSDTDDGGYWDADEAWNLDPIAGTYRSEGQRVVFTCVIPKNSATTSAPYPVMIFGHGYGSSRFDFLGFSWAFARIGWASCALDFPGHGPTVNPEQEELISTVLDALGLYPFYAHLLDARYRDLDNNGTLDSGGDQWTSDAFHTRDMVRQAAVDWMQLVRSLQACGTGTMTLPNGQTAVACDWNGDGTADIGGADARFSVVGGSLGGINAGVAAAVMPEVESFAPIVPGGGLLDVAMRTEIGGAVEAMAGRLMTPLFLGYPDENGGLRIDQMVNSVTEMISLPVVTLPSFPPNGKIILENLDKGTAKEGLIPADGRLRLAIACDAPDPFEKRALAGMPLAGPVLGTSYEVLNNEGLGDRLRIRILDSSGVELHQVDTWESEQVHEGVTMRAGSPLVAASHGSGHTRASPEFRRLAFMVGSVLEAGDPIAYAPHYVRDPITVLGGKPANVLIMPTVGDTIVNVATGVAMARAAGYIDRVNIDPRYGMTQDQYLIDRGVVRGLEEFDPYTCADGTPCLFDVDNPDEDTDPWGAPSDAQPLRITLETASGVVGLRLPYASPRGSHGFGLPEPESSFDLNTFAISQIARYVETGGTEITDDACLADLSCDWMVP